MHPLSSHSLDPLPFPGMAMLETNFCYLVPEDQTMQCIGRRELSESVRKRRPGEDFKKVSQDGRVAY